MSNLNTNYENMKKYKFETLFIKKVQFKHENTCLKHDLWKISSPTVILTVIVQCSFPGALAPCELKTLAQVASVGKNTRVLMKHPWGECSKLLVDWVLGPMAGEMWVNRVAVVMIPVRPGTLTTATRVTQHTPTFGPRDLVHRESRHHPRGVSTDT